MSKKTQKTLTKLSIKIGESELETLKKIDPDNTSRAVRIAISAIKNQPDSVLEFKKLRESIDKNNVSNKRVLGIVAYVLFQFLKAENEIERQESAVKMKIISELLRPKS